MRPREAFLGPSAPIATRVGEPLAARRRARKANKTPAPPRPRVASSDGQGDHSAEDLALAAGDLDSGASGAWTPGGTTPGGRAPGGIASGLCRPALGGIIPGGIEPGGTIPGGTAPGGGIIPSGMGPPGGRPREPAPGAIGMPLGPCLSRCWGPAPGGPPPGILGPPIRLGSIPEAPAPWGAIPGKKGLIPAPGPVGAKGSPRPLGWLRPAPGLTSPPVGRPAWVA